MKVRAVGYWVCTALVGLSMLSGGIGELVRSPQVVEGMTHLGYPPYLLIILGVWKVLGTVAIGVPGFGRVKEWAYAGIMFDLTGASASHLASGDDLRHIVTPLVLGLLTVASWALRPESRWLRRP